ncbi:LGFP repeat-containing protein [Corynebacterium glutamicum]|uniref:LGFP repeat-containing protein n=1 Tax=Corynebacterium glutamicum TaxID=1718 RepID=UPI001E4B75CD|nr:lysozyme [Corynebacterium glutamicum]
MATLLAVPTAIADVFHGRWIRGAIEETYVRLGGHAVWGDAISDETPGARGGTNQHFYNDASIFWNPDVSGGVARQVGGLIRSKWEENDWEQGYLGYPTTDETALPQRTGRFNHFEGGSIYWSPETGAHPVSGAIKQYWSARGGKTRCWDYRHLIQNSTSLMSLVFSILNMAMFVWRYGV